MSNKNIKIIIGLILVLAVGGVVYVKNNGVGDYDDEGGDSSGIEQIAPGSDGVSSYMPEPPPPTSPGASSSGIAMSEVAKHADRSSCWSAIDGSVYDLTSWIPNHPGGEQAILVTCGKDGSTYFNAQHGRSSKPKAILAGFKIGTLAQ